MLGMEYVVKAMKVQMPGLFIIEKRHRRGPMEVAPVAEYYILQGTVYQ